ncbi:MurR/RpiR family transcriptional regulator [Pseudonocardia nantongensis]|uniref:MurR/RpiR family transcriptional regulator n=1 Tax=Pseudonocardia nantongensis TaxID=1181885 RepID=UPI00397B92C7
MDLISTVAIVGGVSTSTAASGGSGERLTGSVRERIRGLTPSLSPTGRRIAEVVMRDPGRVVELTVTDLAVESGTSLASVVRFCQDLDLRGFGDLKLRLAAESARPADVEAEPADGPGGILASVLRSSADALAAAASTVDPDAFTAVVDVVAQARHVLVVGVGTSAPLAQDCAYRFRSIGLLAEAPPDAHVQHVSAALLRPGAACLAISHTGQTRETLAAVTSARDAGGATIGITSFHRSPLTEVCDHSVVAGSHETRHHVEARASRLVHSAVLDAIHAAIAQNHPGLADAAARRAAHIVAEHRM